MSTDDLETRAINTIRALAMDLPRAADSGHQGTAMALAPLAHVLWTRIMDYDPEHPDWSDRDRFVLSAGHASVLLYSMLHLTGYDLGLDDLRAFRQWGSRTPGHPEYGHTPGVEVTTGPLGQGFANGVGMAIAERFLRAEHGAEIVDHRTFVIAGDGCLSEGVSHEAASLAGHLGLDRLICFYDDNRITIDGPTDLALSDDAVGRFRSYGWQVIDLGERAEDLEAIESAISEAEADSDRPSLIVLRSHIGTPSPRLTGDPAAHGLAFDADDISETKEILGLPDVPFHIDPAVADLYRGFGAKRARARVRWQERVESLDDGARRAAAAAACVPTAGWEDSLPEFETGAQIATRAASGRVFSALVDVVPGLIGGGADLSGNTGTLLAGEERQSAEHPGGKQIFFGVREHAMGAIMNGLAAHGGILPVGGTFFVFSDYMRPAVRLAALSGHRVIHSWTHDSVGVGEDGPTHQPIEHLASMRAMPGLRVVRPADANETVAAWVDAIAHDGPTALVLSRQNLPVLDGTDDRAQVSRGAYVLAEDGGDPEALPDVVLVGSGSEVAVCLEASGLLIGDGLRVRTVSMPCWEDFDEQDPAYQASVLPGEVPTVAVEAGATFGWERWADETVGIDRFGGSAPGDVAMRELGITPEHVVEVTRTLLATTGDPAP